MRAITGSQTFLSRQPKAVVLGLSLGSIGLLAWIDYVTGYEISFALFYLVPIGLVAWYIGPWPAVLVSVLSAASWLLANQLAGQTFSNPLIVYWNTGIRLGFFVITTLLLTALRRGLDLQRELARTDLLTGALNGRAFTEVALSEILRARRHGRPLTVAYLDLDDFKAVNDRFGHSTGDEVLQTVVSVIKATMRATDCVARMGGDEFAAIFPETDMHAARLIAARIRERISHEMRRNDWPVTMSIGIVTCREPPEAVDAVLQAVDSLMYAAKRAGKDAVHYREYGSIGSDAVGTSDAAGPASRRADPALEP